MSEIRATTISDSAGTGPITLTKQSAAKVYCNVNQTGTQAIRDSLNVSSVTDDGTGQTDIAYTSNMSSADYGFTCGKGRSSAQNGGVIAHTNDTDPTASLIRIMAFNEANTTIDEARANVSVHGDLA